MRPPMSLTAQKRLINTYRRAIADGEFLRDHERRAVATSTIYTNELKREDAKDDTDRFWSNYLNAVGYGLKFAERDCPEAVREIDAKTQGSAK